MGGAAQRGRYPLRPNQRGRRNNYPTELPETEDEFDVSLLKLAIRGLLYHWRINATVALGVAAATAVLTGALVVGDSVRESLRDMTLDRLGSIDEVLISDHFFAASLAGELPQQPGFQTFYQRAVGVMLFPQATVQRRSESKVTRASNVLAIGSDASPSAGSASFWDLGNSDDGPSRRPESGEIVLNRQLADELDVQVGDTVTLRLPKPENIPADSPLGEKTDLIRSLPDLKVIDIIENRGLGRLSLRPRQTAPSNAYVSLEQLQSALRQSDRINSILVAGPTPDLAPGEEASAALATALHPSLDDLGLKVSHPRLIFAGNEEQPGEVIYDYYSISSDRMILPPAAEQAAASAFEAQGGQPVLTYLANLIEPVTPGERPAQTRIPYSLITAISSSPHFVLRDLEHQPIGELAADEIALTAWAANDLAVGPGDWVRIAYFEPESRQGASEQAVAELKVKAIVALTPPAEPYLPTRQLQFTQRPTVANDPSLTPEVEGVTDQRSIDDWEVPFVIDNSLLRSQDDLYWQDYATTPKAYVSLTTGRRLWGSRFGDTTSYRIPAGESITQQEVQQQLLAALAAKKSALGFAFQPIKRLQLDASKGNTPFDVLFLFLSFFIIAAALLLVALLFRLGFEQRAGQAGLLLATGWNRRRVRRLLVMEGLGAAIVGSGLGVVIALGYAAMIIAALQSRSWWLGAITTPFLEFHFTTTSLITGYVAGVFVSVLTIFWSVYRTRGVAARQLLVGNVTAAEATFAAPSRWSRWAVMVLVVVSVGLAIGATRLSGQGQAGAFVGSGAAILVALLLGIGNVLRRGGQRLAPLTGSAPLLMLALRSAARNPTRSTLTIGLIATACFLIVAMSAFRLTPTDSGTGGFRLMAELSQPIFADLNSETGRDELLGNTAAALRGSRVYAFRVRPGDDASCGNLYKAQQPRVLGVPPSFTEHFDEADGPAFQFAASATKTDQERRNPWHVLPHLPTPDGDPIPVVIDKETAMYSLQLYGGVGEEFTFTYDQRPITFRVAGLLSLSILHGNLLISEVDFRQLFPNVSGYRFALLNTPGDRTLQVMEELEDRLSDQGFDAQRTERVLSGLMALQNTYLRTFQTLGALGLLLGTFGLAAVQLRSVLERRGEMALLRAAGFRRRRLAQMVLYENVLLLLAGLAAGVVAAVIAVLPHMFGGGAAIPFTELASMFALVLLVGIAAGWLAARATLRVPLLAALREER